MYRARKSPEIFVFLLWLIMPGFSACGPPLPTLEGIDIGKWKTDKMGCDHIRAESVDKLNEQRNELLTLSEIQILKLLGKPDENELYERNQKFYRYYLEPGPSCDVPATGAKFLSIRFNATGRAQEVAIE